MDNRAIRATITTLAIFLVATQLVSAFGISTPYWKAYPLEILPGETKEVPFNLQNCPSLSETCDKTEINVIVSLEEGQGITEITSGDSYQIPYGTANTNVVLKLTIPEDAKSGDSYNIKFSVTSAPKDESGNIQLGVKYNVEFPVKVIESTQVSENTEKPEKAEVNTTSTTILIILSVLIILIIIYLVMRKKN